MSLVWMRAIGTPSSLMLKCICKCSRLVQKQGAVSVTYTRTRVHCALCISTCAHCALCILECSRLIQSRGLCQRLASTCAVTACALVCVCACVCACVCVTLEHVRNICLGASFHARTHEHAHRHTCTRARAYTHTHTHTHLYSRSVSDCIHQPPRDPTTRMALAIIDNSSSEILPLLAARKAPGLMLPLKHLLRSQTYTPLSDRRSASCIHA